ELGVTRARIDIAVRIERDLAVRMPTESDSRARWELLALTAPASCDVVDDNAHAKNASLRSTRILALLSDRQPARRAHTRRYRSGRTTTTTAGLYVVAGAP